MLHMKSLRDRREELCLKFAKKCLKNEKFQKYFPLNSKKHCMTMRDTERFELNKCGSSRYKNSAIPYMISVQITDMRVKRETFPKVFR